MVRSVGVYKHLVPYSLFQTMPSLQGRQSWLRRLHPTLNHWESIFLYPSFSEFTSAPTFLLDPCSLHLCLFTPCHLEPLILSLEHWTSTRLPIWSPGSTICHQSDLTQIPKPFCASLSLSKSEMRIIPFRGGCCEDWLIKIVSSTSKSKYLHILLLMWLCFMFLRGTIKLLSICWK